MGVPYAEVIGDPIARSKSPLIHKFWLEKLGLEGDYRATRVTAEELPDYLASRRVDPDWRGCNVTMPLKRKIGRHLDARLASAGLAINCVTPEAGKLVGSNTDADGVWEAVGRWEVCPNGANVCVVGAGGAARALIPSLDTGCYFEFNVIVRDRGKGQALLDDCNVDGSVFGFDEAGLATLDSTAIVNASPLGMTGFPPMPETVLEAMSNVSFDRNALDMVTSPVETPFLRRARALGLHATDGLDMLIGQARHAFRLFFGAFPDESVDAELRELLTR